MSLKIEIYIEKSPKSNAASYFEYDSEKHNQMIKELKELSPLRIRSNSVLLQSDTVS